MPFRALVYGFALMSSVVSVAHANDDEVTLFDKSGKATAYIALDDELTIYTWGGSPVAYLDRDSSGGYDVYGFNGKHLGWFVGGVLWDHDGAAACAVEEKMRAPQLEPLKSLKHLKPLKNLAQLAPLRPLFSNSFSEIPCRFLLAEGSK